MKCRLCAVDIAHFTRADLLLGNPLPLDQFRARRGRPVVHLPHLEGVIGEVEVDHVLALAGLAQRVLGQVAAAIKPAKKLSLHQRTIKALSDRL